MKGLDAQNWKKGKDPNILDRPTNSLMIWCQQHFLTLPTFHANLPVHFALSCWQTCANKLEQTCTRFTLQAKFTQATQVN